MDCKIGLAAVKQDGLVEAECVARRQATSLRRAAARKATAAKTTAKKKRKAAAAATAAVAEPEVEPEGAEPEGAEAGAVAAAEPEPELELAVQSMGVRGGQKSLRTEWQCAERLGCGQWKPTAAFSKNSMRMSGGRRRCIDCVAAA